MCEASQLCVGCRTGDGDNVLLHDYKSDHVRIRCRALVVRPAADHWYALHAILHYEAGGDCMKKTSFKKAQCWSFISEDRGGQTETQ